MVATKLPKLGEEGQFLVYLAAVIDKRIVKKGNSAVVQWLVQWSHSIPEDASWEDATAISEQYHEFNPRGKGLFQREAL